MYDGLPPLPFDVVLQLHTKRAVVPGRAQTAVDLAAGKDETSSLAEVDDRVDRYGRSGGHESPSGWRSAAECDPRKSGHLLRGRSDYRLHSARVAGLRLSPSQA